MQKKSAFSFFKSQDSFFGTHFGQLGKFTSTFWLKATFKQGNSSIFGSKIKSRAGYNGMCTEDISSNICGLLRKPQLYQTNHWFLYFFYLLQFLDKMVAHHTNRLSRLGTIKYVLTLVILFMGCNNNFVYGMDGCQRGYYRCGDTCVRV